MKTLFGYADKNNIQIEYGRLPEINLFHFPLQMKIMSLLIIPYYLIKKKKGCI